MVEMKFRKEEGGWFVVLPEYDGPKEDLAMVLGADTMLDIIAQGEFELDLTISEESSDSNFELRRLKEDNDGYWYLAKSDLFEFEVWLCKVTKFVFGYFPETIYIT